MQHPIVAMLETQERSLSWLARKTGKSPSYVLRVTTGERRPSEDFKARAAEALGVPVAILFPATPTPESAPVPQEAIP